MHDAMPHHYTHGHQSIHNPLTMATSSQQIGKFVHSLAAKQPTPGGGAAAAVGAAIGASAARMAAAYTQRKKDIESGAAAKAQALIESIHLEDLLKVADDDAEAYADLQRTWKDSSLSDEEKASIEARALAVPTTLVEKCHLHILAIQEFLPHCNPNITSDAKVGIHQLAGAARAAFQTVMVNKPSVDERKRLHGLLQEIRQAEDELLDSDE
jgi:formiminotetrahydrofolate cyclodeaminase